MTDTIRSQQLRMRLDQLGASLRTPERTARPVPVALKQTSGEDRVHGESY